MGIQCHCAAASALAAGRSRVPFGRAQAGLSTEANPSQSAIEPIAKAIPGAQFKVLPVGHYAGLQKPELVAGEIAAFLDGAGV